MSGPHLYRSVIVLLIGNVPIISMSVWFGVAPISIGHVPITFRVQFDSGPHLYRSVIHPVSFSLVWVGVAPISIGHVPITFCVSLVFGTAPISIGHCFVSLSWGRTYIDQSSSYHPHVSLIRDRTYIDWSCSYHFFVFSLSRDRTYIDRSFILSVSV